MLTGPIAAVGVIAGAWGGSHLATRRAAGATASTVADRIIGGAPADGLTPANITVRVRLSAPLQAEVHEQAVSVTLPSGASVGTLLNRLSDTHPVLAAMGPNVMVAVSGQMESPERVLVNGEVVDLVSQMAGG